MSRKVLKGAGRPRFSDVLLCESVFSGPAAMRVDREKGIIYDVKILGRESVNDHGVAGASKGTRYLEHAMRDALPLYEGALTNKNHSTPNKENPFDSDPDKRNGWFTNVRVTPDGIFGDYNLLLSDPLTSKLFEAAERNPRLFSMSHNAYGAGKVVDGWFVIEKITKVETIDVVRDGGTNVSLRESKGRRSMKTTLKKLLESSTNPKVQAFAKKSHVVKLLELDGLGASAMDEPAPDDEPSMSWKDHLGEMLKSMVSDESMDPAEIKKKLNAALKLLEEGDKDEGDESIDLEESCDDDAMPPKKKKKDDDSDDGKETKESLRRENARLKDLGKCRRLCESEGFARATEADIARIQKMDDDADRKWLIAQLKGGQTPSQRPTSQAPGTKITESKQSKDAEPFVPLLRR